MKAKRLFAAVLSMAIAASAVAGLAACGTETQYLDTWTTSAEGHWHASVDNPDIIGDYGDHTFKDGKCTVCEYPDPNYNPGGGDGGDGGGGGGSDIGGGGGDVGPVNPGDVLSNETEFPAYIKGVFSGWEDVPLYLESSDTWTYSGHHYYIKGVELTANDGFCFYDSYSGEGTQENPDDHSKYYKYADIWTYEGQTVSDYFTEVDDGFGGMNPAAKASGTYDFDLYIGTTWEDQPQAPHINFTTTVSPTPGGGGSGDVGGGDHSTWDTLTIHYHNAKDWANPYAYSWETGYETKFLGNWPGTPATAESDGWVKITYQVDPAARGSLMIIFNDGKENGADQTGDIDISGITNNEAWIAKDESVHATQAEALAAEGTAQETTYTFYFYNAGGWGTVKIWTWGAFATAGAWSDAPTMEAATELGNGWFKYTYTGYASKVEGKSLSVIVFNGSNDSQRVTIGNTSGQDAVADSGDPITITATTYYISGAQNGKYSTTKEDIHA